MATSDSKLLEWAKIIIPNIFIAVGFVVSNERNTAILAEKLDHVTAAVEEIKSANRTVDTRLSAVERNVAVVSAIGEGNTKAIDRLFQEKQRGR